MSTVALAHEGKEVLAVIFFVSAVLIGNFMLLNLFLAILLKYLQDAVEEVRDSQKKLKEQQYINEARSKAAAIDKQRAGEFHDKIYKNENKDQNNQAAQSA